MRLKVNYVRRPGGTYQYAQLVQSVRDERGKPVRRVVALAEQALTSAPLHRLAKYAPFVHLAIVVTHLATGRADEARTRVRRVAAELKSKAESFVDPEFSHNFLNDLPEHRRILELAAQGPAESG